MSCDCLVWSYFRKCITQSCYWFHSQTTELFKRPEVVDVSSANNALQNNFPWFQFLVIQSSASDSTVDNDGTFHINSKTIAVQKTYHIFWTDSFVRFSWVLRTEWTYPNNQTWLKNRSVLLVILQTTPWIRVKDRVVHRHHHLTERSQWHPSLSLLLVLHSYSFDREILHSNIVRFSF